MLSISIAVYNIALQLYHAVAIFISPFSSKARLWVNGRKETKQKLQTFTLSQSASRVWFHCSSLGEFEQARPLIEAIKNDLPDSFIYLSFFSPSGYEIVKNKKMADFVFYLPNDTKSNAELLLQRLQPTLVFWTKYDFFFHILNGLKKVEIPTILFSSRFLPKQIFFQKTGILHREMLKCFSLIFVQDENSKQLLNTIKISSKIAADTRFDRVIKIASTEFKNEIIESFIQQTERVFVAGSTWQKDEEIIAAAFEKQHDFKLIIAPHQIDKKHLMTIKECFEKRGKQLAFYSNFTHKDIRKEALVIDNFGMLAQLYRYAQICYVGGGFGAGVHNILEAVVYKKGVIIGANFEKSLEAVNLIKHGIAFSVLNAESLLEKVQALNENNMLESISEKAFQYINKNKGGTKIIIQDAKKYYN